MAIASKLTSVGIIVFSFAIGFLAFYLYTDFPKEDKKKYMEELISQLINLVIFIWLGKIIFNLSTFIADPLSILAYPSDSKSFYLAIILTTSWFLYKAKRKKVTTLPLLVSFVQIFLISSFVYEFIQFVIVDNPYAFNYLILLAILIGLLIFLQERLATTVLLMVLLSVWKIGMVVLMILQPFITVFGYMMKPWFVGMIFFTSVIALIYKSKRRST